MSPLIVKHGMKPRFHYRGIRAALAVVFLFGSVAFLWSPTRRLAEAFRAAKRFQNVSLPRSRPASEGFFNGLEATGAAKRTVTFRLLAPAAKGVGLGGTFNNFQAEQNPLSRRADGVWEKAVDLLPGLYVYKFKVDGEWELDPTNPENTREGRGGSVLKLQ